MCWVRGGGRGTRGWACMRAGGSKLSSAPERHRAADRSGGAAGAGQSRVGSPGRSWTFGGRGHQWGPHRARRGRIPPSIIHGGEYWCRRGKCLAVPSRPNWTGTSPAGGRQGGRAGLGTGALRPGSQEFAGRHGEDLAGPGARLGKGVGGECLAGSEASLERTPGAEQGPPRAAAP